MKFSEAIHDRVNKLCVEKELSFYKVAKLGGLTESTLYGFMSEVDSYPTVFTLCKIVKAFNMEISEFFDDPIFDKLDKEL